MRSRGLVIALVLFLGLFAWLRFVEFRPKPPAGAAPDSAFMAVPALNVRSLSVTFHADSTTIERRDGRWWIVSPVVYPADPIPVGALLARCENLPLLRHFPLEPGEAPRYGLDRPSCRVVLRESTGRVTTLLMGAPAPASPAFFVQVAGVPRVGLLRDNEADDYFRREMDEWRLPRVLEMNPAAVVGVTLRGTHGVVELARANSSEPWRLVRPFPGLAAAAAVEEFLKAISRLEASAFQEDHPRSLVPYGLDAPAAEILVTRAGGARDTISFGAPMTDHPGPPLRYARATGNGAILGVPAAYLSLAGRGDNTLRDRHLLRYGVRRYRVLVLEAGGRRVTLTADSAGAWRGAGAGVDPATDRREMAGAWILGQADSLLPGDRWPAVAGEPDLVVTVDGVDASRQRIEVGRSFRTPDGRTLWPARLTSAELPRPDEVFLLPESLVLPVLALVRQGGAGGPGG